MTTERRPAALLTVSRQQELSRYTKFDKWGEFSRIDFGADYGVVRADEGDYPYHPC
jgi:hypothetical protein